MTAPQIVLSVAAALFVGILFGAAIAISARQRGELVNAALSWSSARDVTCELVRAVEGWRHAASQRRVEYAPHGGLILRALDFRPGAQMPRATVAREVGK